MTKNRFVFPYEIPKYDLVNHEEAHGPELHFQEKGEWFGGVEPTGDPRRDFDSLNDRPNEAC